MTSDEQDNAPSRLAKDIEDVLNHYSAENGSDTPDFILAHYLMMCLEAFHHTARWREQWYGRVPAAGKLPSQPPEVKQS